MDLLYLSVCAGFLGAYAFFAIAIARLESIAHHLERISQDVGYTTLMVESELKRKIEEKQNDQR